MKKILIHKESGSAYRISKEDVVEFAVLSSANSYVISDDEFWPVDYSLVGDETIMHNGLEVKIKDFEHIIREYLSRA